MTTSTSPLERAGVLEEFDGTRVPDLLGYARQSCSGLTTAWSSVWCPDSPVSELGLHSAPGQGLSPVLGLAGLIVHLPYGAW